MPSVPLDQSGELGWASCLPTVVAATLLKQAVTSLLSSGLYAIYFVLICLSTWDIVWRIRERRRQQPHRSHYQSGVVGLLVILATTWCMFTIATFMWSVVISCLVQLLDRLASFDEDPMRQSVPTEDGKSLFSLWLSTRLPLGMANVMFFVQFLLGDILVIWRVISLYRRATGRTWVSAILVSLWLAVLLSGSIYCKCVFDWGFEMVGEPLPQSCIKVSWKATWALSLILNGISTALLFNITLQWRRTCAGEVSTSTTGHILRIIVASGVVYCLLGILRLAVNAASDASVNSYGTPNKSASLAASLTDVMMQQIVGIYPTMLMVVVRFEVVTDRSNLSIGRSFTTTGTIGFARAPTSTTVITTQLPSDDPERGAQTPGAESKARSSLFVMVASPMTASSLGVTRATGAATILGPPCCTHCNRRNVTV